MSSPPVCVSEFCETGMKRGNTSPSMPSRPSAGHGAMALRLALSPGDPQIEAAPVVCFPGGLGSSVEREE